MYLLKTRGAFLSGTAVFLLAGCGGSVDHVPVPPPVPVVVPSTLPHVIYSSRSDSTLDAAVNTDIVAVFSEPLDPASVTAATVTVKGDDSVSVPGSVSYDAARNAIVFLQAGDLGAQRYTATIAPTVKDAAGNAMAQAYSWKFTVSAARRDTPVQKTLQQILDKAAYTYQIPGSIIAVRDDTGRTWTTTNGYADIVSRAPITSNMKFRIGSNTKPFVATMVLQLVDEGKIGLDAPIKSYINEEFLYYMPTYYNKPNVITVRHLLNHTSGIANFTTDPGWNQAYVNDPLKTYAVGDLLRLANGQAASATAPVFNNFAYSNTNYVLLGLIIRNASGETYEQALSRRILQPQGLLATAAPPIGDGSVPAPFTRGYFEDPETKILRDVTQRDSSTVWSSGNITSTITDLLRWGDMLGRGTLISSAMQGQRLQYKTMTANLDYGLGIVKDKGANMIGHQGGIIGYSSQVYYLPDTGYTVAFMYNRTLNLHDYSAVMTYDALNALFPGRANTPIPTALMFQPPRSDFTAY